MFKRKALFLSIMASLGLMACKPDSDVKPFKVTQSSNVEQQVTEQTASQNEVFTEQLKKNADEMIKQLSNGEIDSIDFKNLSATPEAVDFVNKVIDIEAKAGKIKKEDISQEEIDKLSKIITGLFVAASNGNNEVFKQADIMSALLSEKPVMDENGNIVTAQKSNSKKDVFDSRESEKLASKIKSNIKDVLINEIKKVEKTPFFAVYINNSENPLFTTESAKYYFLPDLNKNVGGFPVIDEKGVNIDPNDTVKMSAVYEDVLKLLDKKKLISLKFGKGERELYVFTDPDCPFCLKQDKDFISNLNDNDNVTIYYVMTPLAQLHPEAPEKAKRLLCSPNPSESYHKWQLSRIMPSSSVKDTSECENNLEGQRIFSEILGLYATPTNITKNGIFVQETLSSDNLRKLISSQ